MPRRELVPPDPPLTDGVVLLRPWEDADVDALVAACQDAEIRRFIPVPTPYGVEQAMQYVERTRRQWTDGSKAAFAIVEPDDPTQLLGAINVALFAAIGNSGYWVAPEARGRGVAGRSLRLLSAWVLHELDVGVMLLEIRPENERSRAVATAAGFHESGHLDVNMMPGKEGALLFTRLAADPPP